MALESIQTNWYVITGGPSTGKTDTLYHLGFLGFHTLPEAARVLINDQKSHGKTLDQIRADELAFQSEVLRMKVEAEERLNPKDTIFLDRGIPDTIGYDRMYGLDETLPNHLLQKRRYKGIFLLDPVPFDQDGVRIEDEAFTLKLNGILGEVYAELGYKVIKVPKMSIGNRANFIIEHL